MNTLPHRATTAATALLVALSLALAGAAPASAHTGMTRFYGWWHCELVGCAFYKVYQSGDLDSRRCYVTTHRHAYRQFGVAISDTITWYQGPDFIC